jgi:hypothetical protein
LASAKIKSTDTKLIDKMVSGFLLYIHFSITRCALIITFFSL